MKQLVIKLIRLSYKYNLINKEGELELLRVFNKRINKGAIYQYRSIK